MRKYILLYAVAALSAGCMKTSVTELYVPDETLRTTGKVTLCLSVEDLSTKVSVDDNGHFMFGSADSILVACSDGSYEKFRLDGTGDTRRAFFTGEIPSGKTLGSHVLYPCSVAGTFNGNDITVKLPATQVYNSGYSCPMAGAIGKDYHVQLFQLCSYVKVTISSFPAGVSAVSFNDAGGKTLSGDYTFSLASLGSEGLNAKEGTGAVRFTMTDSPSEAVFSLPCAVGDYNDIRFTLLDEYGGEIGCQSISFYPLSFARAGFNRVGTSSEIKVKVKQVVVDGKNAYSLIETSEGIYEAVVDVTSSSTLAINVDSRLLGFAPYSGAGGIGWCRNAKSALPFYNFKDTHTELYYVGRSVGEVSPLDAGGVDLWVNLDNPGKLRVVYDTNYGTNGSYYMELLSDADPNVLLDEQFDLCTCGGDMAWVITGSQYGSDPSAYDGISASTPAKTGWNASGSKNVMFDYPDKVRSTVASSSYMTSRGLSLWTFARADERPGAIQLCQDKGYDSYCVTPALTSISGTQDIRLEMGISRYSSTSRGPIYVEIIGGGEFVSAHVDQSIGDAFQSMFTDYRSLLSHDYAGLGGSTFTIGTDYCVCVPTAGNTVSYKPVSSYCFNISGATSSTRIKVHAPCPDGDNPPRCIIYGIKITKQ